MKNRKLGCVLFLAAAIFSWVLFPFFRQAILPQWLAYSYNSQRRQQQQEVYQAKVTALAPTARPTARPASSSANYTCRWFVSSNEYEIGKRYCEMFILEEIHSNDEYVALTSVDNYLLGVVAIKKISTDMDRVMRTLQPGCGVKIVGTAVEHPEDPSYVTTYIEQLYITSCPKPTTATEPPRQQYIPPKCKPGAIRVENPDGSIGCIRKEPRD